MKIFYLFLFLPIIGLGQDIREKVRKGKVANKESRLIDPNDSIFGFKVGTSEDELLEAKGKAKGYVRLSAGNSAIFFDGEVSYIFTDEKLSGVTVGMSLIDSQITRYFSGREEFRRIGWKLDNGIRENMDLDDVKKILGDKLKKSGIIPSEYRQYYEDGASEVHLSFSSTTLDGGKRRFMLHALMVVPK